MVTVYIDDVEVTVYRDDVQVTVHRDDDVQVTV